jgi:hypothetical protein
MREQFCGILYSYATRVVLLNFTVYITVLCHMFITLFCKHFWDPKHVHRNIISLFFFFAVIIFALHTQPIIIFILIRHYII